MKILKENLPKERTPILIEKDNCIKLANITCIHSYSLFDKIIIQPFKNIIRENYVEKFVNTCDYMFKKVGFGVFVFVLNGEIHTFQLFANTTGYKPGSKKITKKQILKSNKNIIKSNNNKLKTNNKTNNKTNKLKNGKSLKFKKDTPITNRNKFSYHYCYFKSFTEWWKRDHDKTLYYSLLKTCLKGTNITTCFFLNLYTFPVLYKRKCNQYILHQDICKNNDFEENKYIPVLSGATTKEHFDKCIVYPDAWEVITKKGFGPICSNNFTDSFGKINTDWNSKKNTIIFRGVNKTCYQIDENKNDRIKTLKILNDINNRIKNDKSKNDESKTNIEIDTGLVMTFPKTYYIDNKMNTTNYKDVLKLIGVNKFLNKVPMYKQSDCKYILDIDGHANPWRICFELSYNSCIIVMLSKYYSWFYDKLKHMENVYIIDVNSKTLEKDLYSCIQTLERNDNIGKKIAKGAVKLYDEIMNFKYIKNYMTTLLTEPEFDIIIK
jgi:hypothetical protein